MSAREEMERQWQTIEMPDGSVIPGTQDYRGPKGDRFLLPADLTGKSVLDLGTWNGFWAIEAQKRGALAVAADRWDPLLEVARAPLEAWGIPYEWSGDLDYPLERFWAGGTFDFVLFYGILYHLKNPVMGLMNATFCCKPGGTVIVESVVNKWDTSTPLLRVVDAPVSGDPSVYFMPNIPGVLQLCRLAGLEPTEQVALEDTRFTVVCRRIA